MLQEVIGHLGPWPRDALAAMIDYSRSNTDIGRFCALPEKTVAALRKLWSCPGVG
ncbi:hypothetical protein SAMN05444722_2424 [Rhodovulum sp. ES.010]|uniref:hypothetical protein n=1 Tax=Rhodovulum sp. ES.010 TaxID=1882821 RepID=UPI00092BB4A1|nr:hypothetical protein [Rhodovulum sp. ES.010]SIO47537.1 hypothetical protein SAMN05444722_2424 [Rhodovulum sp. ES.010]